MRLGISYNIDKDRNFEKTYSVVCKLKEVGIDFYFFEKTLDYPTVNVDISIEELDCVLVLGGDGTVLRASKQVVGLDIPILGINIGHLGFLTSYEFDELDKAIDALLGWNFIIEERGLIKTIFEDKSYYALNDIVISRVNDNSPYGKVAEFTAFVQDKIVDNFLADGIIVATPTGSTAYSLSAGGPIVEPSVKVNIITPICSHSLHNRPICINSSDDIYIELKKANIPCNISIDGDVVADVCVGDVIKIEETDKTIKLLKPKGESFYTRLYTKMTKWSGN